MRKKVKPYRLGYEDGSGMDTVTKDGKAVLVPSSVRGCGCCAGEATDEDRMMLAVVVEALNAALSSSRSGARRARGR